MRVLVLCLCVCAFFGVISGQVASLCRANERLLSCGGCQRTCLEPARECAGVCRTGCYCDGDLVRNETGHCVKLEECPPLPATYKQDTTEPRPLDAKCPENEEYRFCEPCNRTCDNPNPICPAQCARGCFCVDDLVRDRDGRCVKPENCSNLDSSNNRSTSYILIPPKSYILKPIPLKMVCNVNQEYKDCETCEKTCSNPNPVCPAQCSRGCFCKEGLYKAPNGDCLELEKCPKAATYKHNTTEPDPLPEPVLLTIKCPDSEEYRFCETCNRTCDNPIPICPAQCVKGCFCVNDLVRDRDGRCVKLENCSNQNTLNEASRKFRGYELIEKEVSTTNWQSPKPYPEKPIPYIMVCSANQEYKDCETCEKTCSNPNPVCPAQCSRGCFCKEGFYRAPNGDCLELEKCPKAEVSIGSADLSVEDCDVDEEFFACGACEPTCSQPRPACPQEVCTRGCQCRPPLIRHRSGQCVPKEMCSQQKCVDPHEKYGCRYGCEAWCDRRRCVRPRRCELGCHCRLGLLRDHLTGNCVEEHQCSPVHQLTTITESNETLDKPYVIMRSYSEHGEFHKDSMIPEIDIIGSIHFPANLTKV